jgi:hypothetical protein
MRILLGMMLGALITVGAAFVYDSSTGRAANGLTVASAEGHPPMVNWGRGKPRLGRHEATICNRPPTDAGRYSPIPQRCPI